MCNCTLYVYEVSGKKKIKEVQRFARNSQFAIAIGCIMQN